jgi:hypothetical protein
MNVEVKIVAPDLAEALNNLADAIRGRTGAFVPATTAEATAEPEKPKTAAKPAAKKPTTQPTPEPETAGVAGETAMDQAAPASGESESGSAIDYAQVKAAVMKVSTTKGRQAAVDLLAEFDAKVGGDLTEEQWGPFLARADEVLG